MTDKLATISSGQVELRQPMQLNEVKTMVNSVLNIMKEIMRPGADYGKIPGCGEKPTLLQPGAEKLSMGFRLLPKFEISMNELPNSHREYTIVCTLEGPDGGFRGQGVGLCSTMESKFRYRNADRKCPSCGATAVRKGRPEYGGGWYCSKKDGGCGSKWPDGATEIEVQKTKVEHPDIADIYNTVLKMAKKRAFVSAVITATSSSDLFTQDIEDNPSTFTRQNLSVDYVEPEPRQIVVDMQTGEIVNDKVEDDLPPTDAYEDAQPSKQPAKTNQSNDDNDIKDRIKQIHAMSDEDKKKKIGRDYSLSNKQLSYMLALCLKAGFTTFNEVNSFVYEVLDKDDYIGRTIPNLDDIIPSIFSKAFSDKLIPALNDLAAKGGVNKGNKEEDIPF